MLRDSLFSAIVKAAFFVNCFLIGWPVLWNKIPLTYVLSVFFKNKIPPSTRRPLIFSYFDAILYPASSLVPFSSLRPGVE